MKLSLQEIARLLGAKNDVTKLADVTISKIEFDSRLIGKGDLFVPLKGARDGHDFIPLAFENGCAVTLSEKPLAVPHILVDDCLLALQTLASYYLDKMAVDVIAVTGSNGKTTTKDMIHDLLATSYKTYKTQGNYNNEIGLPYTVLSMPDDTEKLVLEMGQDHLGDIELLSKIARPKLAVVTLIGEAHLEFFGTRQKIAQGKMQISAGMQPEDLLLLPQDDLLDDLIPVGQRLLRFGPGGDLYVTDLVEAKDSLTFKTNFLAKKLTIPVTGKYNATNAMLAAYVAKEEGVSEDKIVAALANIQLTRNRTEWKKASNGADILSDVYNANPTAMRLILETFANIPKNEAGRKLVVLADMKELGPTSFALHEQMIDSLSPADFDRLYLYGQEIKGLADLAVDKFGAEAVAYFVKSNQEDAFDDLLAAIKEDLQAQDQVLLKGSNSMNLAKIVEELEK
ncbi:UDP-N-acetylmuramoyl-tripeptide--D-alanyl-D-alanine ligase [Streptococcus cuniculipharyngis]|uniref:UDP-N-acetylmuramoyl-tripeptide--D-alanyl-D-alanine ligase n=1 Tax=Streptococcus cuniculipharyngis TaxID=1562651 RepID=A0A5C5SF26_9STRE|nr:UDP-N-acetylmuramoyl-tripeptide--D-alanyl-D-alanine ligase [Streptococcus cuniculipharyngis]TWS98655.1 UDP-N-acetylmuramoyl-tripeptide--D-alanyl-D-alanine ligase [Streptococcus cuniculipharyngis]